MKKMDKNAEITYVHRLEIRPIGSGKLQWRRNAAHSSEPSQSHATPLVSRHTLIREFIATVAQEN